MVRDTIKELLRICESAPARFREIPFSEFTAKPGPAKWSKKEILGHLCDSAMVNISRLLRGRIEHEPQIFYQQDQYVNMQRYQEYDREKLISLWEALNRHYAFVAALIPSPELQKICLNRLGKPQTLQYLIDDYLAHLQHHLQQVLNKE